MNLNPIEVRVATAADRLPLFRMLELYQHDLSDIWDQELDVHGEYGYELDRYWRQANCHPFVALVNGHYAGFALVDGSVKVAGSGHWMDQFFVLKKYRRSGLGKAMALRVFSQLPGYWEVGQMPDNTPAQAFWRAVIADLTDGAYTEQILTTGWWQGIVQCFGSDSGT
jgi:predicted acetyltransferase